MSFKNKNVITLFDDVDEEIQRAMRYSVEDENIQQALRHSARKFNDNEDENLQRVLEMEFADKHRARKRKKLGFDRHGECRLMVQNRLVQFHGLPNSGGGNCQYESIAQALADQIHGGHQEIRDAVADAIENDVKGEIVSNEGLRSIVISEPQNYAGINPEQSICRLRLAVADRVRVVPTWGDHMTLLYAGAYYGVCFITIRKIGKKCTSVEVEHNACEAVDTAIVLLYEQDVHYRLAVFDIEGESEYVKRLNIEGDELHGSILYNIINNLN